MANATRSHEQTSSKRRKPYILVAVLILCAVLIIWAIAPSLEAESYPLEYREQIQENARTYELDPYLVAAVIRTESRFDPNAVSSAGARGLMQLMPETGAWIAEKLGVTDYTDDMLFDPSLNIRFGCWYLDFLAKRFDDRRDLVAAAYNAGHNRVSEWLEDDTIAPSGELTNIPYRETSDYVERITKAEQKYRKYYPQAFAGSGAS